MTQMIHKIIELQSIGSFKKCKPPYANWDGVFSKVNLIFGQNRSGKTTFSMILKSLSGSDKLLKKKKRFGSDELPTAQILDSDRQKYAFNGQAWDRHVDKIKIFDIHFIEDNLYTGYSQTTKNSESLFEIIIGKPGVSEKLKLLEKLQQRRANRRQRAGLRRLLSKLPKDGDQIARAEIQSQIDEVDNKFRILIGESKAIDIRLGKYAQDVFANQIEKINELLKVFAPNILIRKISKNQKNYVTFTLNVHGHDVYLRSTSDDKYDAKYVLSEGDRNALAFAFFLAQLEIDGHTEDDIIVFDDPISSFDYSRKLLTVNHLYRLSKRCKQIFVLSHDLHFYKSIYDKFVASGEKHIQQIEIANTGSESTFSGFDCEIESLSGIFKDLQVINNYIKNGAASDIEKRDVKRCIRPVLEGYIRIKFFGEFNKNEWLGDMINKIRLSEPGSVLHSAKQHLHSLEDLNDYSKELHHSDPSHYENSINTHELSLMTANLKSLLVKL